MDKKRIIKNKDLLYESSVSLATAAVFTLEEDILFEKKSLLKRFGDVDEFGIRRVSS